MGVTQRRGEGPRSEYRGSDFGLERGPNPVKVTSRVGKDGRNCTFDNLVLRTLNSMFVSLNVLHNRTPFWFGFQSYSLGIPREGCKDHPPQHLKYLKPWSRPQGVHDTSDSVPFTHDRSCVQMYVSLRIFVFRKVKRYVKVKCM